MTKQCHILKLSRSSVYYMPVPVSDKDRELMRLIDEIHLEEPYLGSRGMRNALRMRGYTIGRIHVRTLMRKMGIEALYRKPRLSKPHPGHTIYPYLLRGLDITEAKPGMGFRYYVHPHGKGLLLSRRRHGLGKQEGIVLEGIEHAGYLFLHRGPGRSNNEIWNTRYIQYRPGEPVYLG